MSSLSTARAGDGAAPDSRGHDWRPWGAVVAVGLTYYAGARIGLSLTFMPFPLSVLWPPNAVLFGALLLAPVRWWGLLVLGALPAHLVAELQANIPMPMVLGWFASNVSEALIGAFIVRQFGAAWSGLRSVSSVLVLCFAAVAAPFLSSFLDAGLVRLIGWGDADYWMLWRARFFTNVVAALTVVPVVMTCAVELPSSLRGVRQERLVEACLLLAGLLVAGTIVFDVGLVDLGSSPTLLYLPLPFLLWAALRFGPALTSVSFAIVVFLVIWGAGHGQGPFLSAAAHESAIPIQLFLITIAVPLMLLAAVIEERRQSAQRLRASEELFATAFRAGPDAIAISRRSDGLVIEANDRWLDLLGYERGAPVRGRVASLAEHAADGSDHAGRTRLLTMLRESQHASGLEVTLRDCRGVVRNVLVSLAPIELQAEACAICILHDVTEQRQAEEQADEQRRQLTHLTRVASLTDFSSTIAHELNQPLTAILSNAQAALRYLERDPPDFTELRSILTEIADADKRAGLLIHHLRLLMKRGGEEFVFVDPNQVVRDALVFAHGAFMTGGVQLNTHFSPGIPQVRGDPVQLQQMLLNLILNACDAMRGQDPPRKRLTVTTSCGHEGSVQVVVSDTGCGISPDHLARLFEPFFTTKENGLGLGLPICRKIALAHKGTLVAESHVGLGATFRLELPPVRTRLP